LDLKVLEKVGESHLDGNSTTCLRSATATAGIFTDGKIYSSTGKTSFMPSPLVIMTTSVGRFPLFFCAMIYTYWRRALSGFFYCALAVLRKKGFHFKFLEARTWVGRKNPILNILNRQLRLLRWVQPWFEVKSTRNSS